LFQIQKQEGLKKTKKTEDWDHKKLEEERVGLPVVENVIFSTFFLWSTEKEKGKKRKKGELCQSLRYPEELLGFPKLSKIEIPYLIA